MEEASSAWRELRAKWDARDHLYTLRPPYSADPNSDAVIAWRCSEARELLEGEELEQALRVASSWTTPTAWKRGRK